MRPRRHLRIAVTRSIPHKHAARSWAMQRSGGGLHDSAQEQLGCPLGAADRVHDGQEPLPARRRFDPYIISTLASAQSASDFP